MRVENDVPLVGACRRNGVVVGGESGVALRLPPQSKIADGWAEGVGLAAVIWRGMTPLWDWETCLPVQAWPERGWLPGRGAEMLAGAETGGVAGRSTTGYRLVSLRDKWRVGGGPDSGKMVVLPVCSAQKTGCVGR